MLEATLMRGEHHGPKSRRAREANAARRNSSGGVQRNGRANLSPETKIRFALKERSSMSRSLTYYAEYPLK
jgi:hypothetical protein